MSNEHLTAREQQVLEAVIHSFVETAEPAGSRTIARRYNLGVSAATIRNTMSDLEERGYLYHPHTSAGRVPTDLAYRFYVDMLMERNLPSEIEHDQLRRELFSDRTAIENLLERAAQVLGMLTQELGLAVAPAFTSAVLERLQLLEAGAGRLLMVLSLRGGAARTLFIEVASDLPRASIAGVALVLNDRLSGLTLQEIRRTLRQRLRDAGRDRDERELLNVFIEEADQLFEIGGPRNEVLLGSTKMLTEQPEFASNEQMRGLLEITERRDLLRGALRARKSPGLTITIGGENVDPRFNTYTIVTSRYEFGSFAGTIGVMGPTRMPYQKVITMVEHTSRLLNDLLRGGHPAALDS